MCVGMCECTNVNFVSFLIRGVDGSVDMAASVLVGV